MLRNSLGAALLIVAACGGGGAPRDEEAAADLAANQIERIAEVQPAEKPKPRPSTLEPLSREEIERELAPGAGCDLSRGGQQLLVAVAGDAIVKVRGRLIHLQLSGPLAPSGGFFTAPNISVSIGRVSDQGIVAGETQSWPALVSLTHGRGENAVAEFEAIWSCGA